jgi:PKD repeat protein
MKKFTFLVFALSMILCFTNVNAQISSGGTPPSIMFRLDNNIPKITFESPDLKKIAEQDKIAEASKPDPRRMGVSVKIDKGINNAGSWETLPGGGKVWRMQIEVPDALALGVYYKDFYLPEGGKLFLYNKDKSQILGAYTSKNNTDSQLFSTQFVQGDNVTLEYWQPENQVEEAMIEVSEVAYAYRDIQFTYNKSRDSWACMIDVACSEGDGWEDQIDGVARISIKIGGSYYWCSGSLINNTENDRTPYFLTASHCGENASASDLNQWVFYFNYQAATCGGNGSGSQTMTGCSLKAKDPSAANAGSDFFLVEFNQNVPVIYQVFYNGWNRTDDNTDAGNGVGIHHPAGDIKKISTYDTPLTSSTFWNGLPTHWKLTWAQTVHGKSIMQGGSSGSPIFDSNGLIMGDLTGGYTSNSCATPSPAYYGKMWYSWDQNGNNASNRLKDWLDPNNTGIEKLPGVSWQNIPPTADFEASNTTVTQGDTVFFSDLSGPGILNRTWTFENGDPASSTEENPFVIYSDTGYYDVTIYVENADGNDTKLKTDYIHVTPMQKPLAEFEADHTVIPTNFIVHFYDKSTNNPSEWAWEFEGGSPATATSQNPQSRWGSEGLYYVKLIASNLGGTDTLVKESFINVGGGDVPSTDFEASNTHISQNQSVDYTDLTSGNPDTWQWTFEGGTPETSSEQNPQGIVYEQGGAFNVSLTASNGYGEDTMLMEDYVLVDWVGLEDLKKANDFRVYPNPGTGIFVIEFGEKADTDVSIEISDFSGKLIQKQITSIKNKRFVLDLSSQNNGVYIITVKSNDTSIVKKISLVK